MPKSAYLTCLWPGLARIWWSGDLRALLVALFFAAILNGLAFYSVNPPVGPFSHVVILGWVLLISWWGASIHSAWSELPFLMGMAVRLSPASKISEAQNAYLRRDYVSTENMIAKILTTEPGDPVVRLLQASVFRQTARFNEARGLLLSLQRDPAALAWQFEIQAELARLERLENADRTDDSSAPEVESKPRVVEGQAAGAPPAQTPSSNDVRRAQKRKAA